MSKLTKIMFRVESDGTLMGTKVINNSTGEMVGLVQKVVWSMDINEGLSKCELTILGMPLDANASVFKLSYINSQNPSVENIIRRTVKEVREEDVLQQAKGINILKENKQKDEAFMKLVEYQKKVEEEKLTSQTQGEKSHE